MDTRQQVIDGLKSMPSEQRSALSMRAAIDGVNIEKDLVPVLVTLVRGVKTVMSGYFENRRFLE